MRVSSLSSTALLELLAVRWKSAGCEGGVRNSSSAESDSDPEAKEPPAVGLLGRGGAAASSCCARRAAACWLASSCSCKVPACCGNCEVLLVARRGPGAAGSRAALLQWQQRSAAAR
jgi:hypothetical protein